jgi:hypothetical protein
MNGKPFPNSVHNSKASAAARHAKVRTGPPLDDEEDYNLPVSAGVIPLRLVAGVPADDPRLSANPAVPRYADEYQRAVL